MTLNYIKKYIFCVQGEGRGHMTQAMVVYELLCSQQHNIKAVIVSTSENRTIPDFFLNYIKAPVYRVKSPNFKTDLNSKKINWFKTVAYNIVAIPDYFKNYYKLKSIINQYKPDVIINFYDVLTGMFLRFNRKQSAVAVAHQYIYLHPDFKFPKGFLFDRLMIRVYTALTTPSHIKKLALSFYTLNRNYKNIIIAPPLLRNELFKLHVQNDNFILVYLVNAGYFEDIIAWHASNSDVVLHCFTDAPEALKTKYVYNTNRIHLHGLCDKTFLNLMSKATGIASTAGFESICEAMYLGKPALMVPVDGHFEQYCNSRDAHYAGAGVFSDRFNISLLQQISNTFNTPNDEFRKWVNSAKRVVYNELR